MLERAYDEQTTVVTVDMPPDPGWIMQLATGYWASAVLLAANEVGLFEKLAGGPRTAAELAEALGTDARATTMLADACCGLNLLVKQGERYILSEAADFYLVPGKRGYMGGALKWAREQYEAWGRLAETVRGGAPAVEPEQHLGGDGGLTRSFVLGMQERALGIAGPVIGYVDLDGATSLLDVGGGPGTYSALFCRKHPELRATVIELPGVAAVTRELIEQQGLSDRIHVVEMDATEADYGETEYDAVLFSGVLHQMDVLTIRDMIAAAWRALRPGGQVIVSDVMSDATRTQPVFATLFSIQMLLTTRHGGVFAVEDLTAALAQAGFADPVIHRLPPPLPYSVVTARR